jgi:signal peptidase I
MRPRRTAKLIAGGLALAAFVALWLFTAPTSLGGSTTWVVTDGVSMEPRFHAGDLAIVRSEPSYRVGQIVAYHSNSLHTIVLHRIIGRDGSRYVFKGDNNNFADFEHPAPDQLLGALWVHAPGLGGRLQSLRSPGLTGGLLALAFLLIAGGVFVGRRRARGRERRGGEGPTVRRPAHLPESPQLAVGTAAALAALPFLLLGALAFSRPASSLQPHHVAYRQSGAFSYSAQTAPGPVYEAGRAVTGEPLFTHVVREAELHFAYRFHSSTAHALHGTIALRASVVSTSGWHTMLALASPQHFSGDRGTVSATLRLGPLLALVHRVEAETQVSGTYTLTLLPSVRTAGTLGGAPVHTSFSPQLALSLAPLELTPVVNHPTSPLAPPPGVAASSFLPSSSGTASGLTRQPAYLSAGPLRLSVAAARAIALAGLVVVALAAAAALTLPRPRRREETAAILARYGRMIVPVSAVREQPGVGVIDVADFEALVRIAEHYDRSILFESTPGSEAFWVSDESGQFRYRAAGEDLERAPEPEPAHAATPEQPPAPVPEPGPPPIIREIRPGPEETWHEPWTPPTASWPATEPGLEAPRPAASELPPAPSDPPIAASEPAASAPSAWAEEQMRELHRLAEEVYADELALGSAGGTTAGDLAPGSAGHTPAVEPAAGTDGETGTWSAPPPPERGRRRGGVIRRLGRRIPV